MIEYLKHNEIDRERWDKCISASPGAGPYAFSWYLDIMAPGWEAMVSNNYGSVFPIPGFKKFGLKYIATPVFLQQLGVFSVNSPDAMPVDEFLDCIPDSYRFIDLNINQNVSHPGFRVIEKFNFELDLSLTYDKLYLNYSRNCRRNITRSLKDKPNISEDVLPDDLIELFRKNYKGKTKGIKSRDYNRLSRLMYFCIGNNKGRIYGVKDNNNKLIYGLFFIGTKGYKTMIFLANSPESYVKRTGYYVYDELIRESAGTNTIFNFSGSSIPSIAFFMQSFGSKNNPYYRIYKNRLPWPLRYLK